MKVNIRALYEMLLKEMGHQGWWPADTKNEIILGAILVQNTNWNNAEKALMNLKAETEFVSEKIASLPLDKIEDLVRSSGFYRNKAKTVKSIFEWLGKFDWDYEQIFKECGDSLRSELLNIKGIGFETADVLLLYVFDQTVFVADGYARRLFSWLEQTEYKTYQSLYNNVILPDDFTLFEAQEFHGLIDEFGKLYLEKTDVKDNFLKVDDVLN